MFKVGEAVVDRDGFSGVVTVVTEHEGSVWYDVRFERGEAVRYNHDLAVPTYRSRMDAAEAEFDRACIALRRAADDYARSRSKKRMNAWSAANTDYYAALNAFKAASSAHSKALAAEVAALKARVTGAAPKQMEMFA